mgnify:CR=1 FL=1
MSENSINIIAPIRNGVAVYPISKGPFSIWFVFSIGIFFFGAEMEASNFRPFGYPLSYYMTCQGSLGIFVILIFWFANRQEKIDEEFGYTEREDD